MVDIYYHGTKSGSGEYNLTVSQEVSAQEVPYQCWYFVPWTTEVEGWSAQSAI
jgi:hypothetical protein